MARFSPLFSRLDPVDSERIGTKLMGRVAAKLEEALEVNDLNLNTINGFLGSIGRGLNLPNPRTGWLPPIQALNRAIARQQKVEDRATLAWGLGLMADRLGPEEAAKVCLPVAEVLTKGIEEDVDMLKGFSPIGSLAAMSLWLPPDQAAKVIRLLAARAEKEQANFSSISEFYLLINHLSEEDAGRAARVIVSALAGEKDAKVRWSLGAGLCLVAERMKPAEVLAALERETYEGTRAELAKALKALAGRVPASE
jgi:hypothetical protein